MREQDGRGEYGQRICTGSHKPQGANQKSESVEWHQEIYILKGHSFLPEHFVALCIKTLGIYSYQSGNTSHSKTTGAEYKPEAAENSFHGAVFPVDALAFELLPFGAWLSFLVLPLGRHTWLLDRLLGLGTHSRFGRMFSADTL